MLGEYLAVGVDICLFQKAVGWIDFPQYCGQLARYVNYILALGRAAFFMDAITQQGRNILSTSSFPLASHEDHNLDITGKFNPENDLSAQSTSRHPVIGWSLNFQECPREIRGDLNVFVGGSRTFICLVKAFNRPKENK